MSASESRISVLLVDDHPAIRDALASTVERKIDLRLLGTAASAAEAMDLIREEAPDVVVADLSLPDTHGLDLVQNLRAQHPEIRALIFSMYDENIYAERALQAGAKGYLMKSEETQTVIEAIRSVNDGEVYLSRKMTSRILGRVMDGKSDRAQSAVDTLSNRELTVFQMLGEGASPRDIAERLNLARKTVETHRRRAKEKLGFETVSQLLQFAVRWTHGQGATSRAATPTPPAQGR